MKNHIYNCSNNSTNRNQNIRKSIFSRGCQRIRINFFSAINKKKCKKNFYRNCYTQYNKHNVFVFRCFWMNNIFNRFYTGRKTRIGDNCTNCHGRNIFSSTVTEWMFFVRVLARNVCSNHCDDTGNSIG